MRPISWTRWRGGALRCNLLHPRVYSVLIHVVAFLENTGRRHGVLAAALLPPALLASTSAILAAMKVATLSAVHAPNGYENPHGGPNFIVEALTPMHPVLSSIAVFMAHSGWSLARSGWSLICCHVGGGHVMVGLFDILMCVFHEPVHLRELAQEIFVGVALPHRLERERVRQPAQDRHAPVLARR